MIALMLLFLLSVQADFKDLKGKIATIDFFGAEGTDTVLLRNRVPSHIGDSMPTTGVGFHELQESVKKATAATEVSLICCDPSGGWNLFIGMSRRAAPTVRDAPVGAVLLPEQDLEAYLSFIREMPKALERGGAKEDRSKGYALSVDDALRATQLHMREVALQDGGRLLEVLDTSANKQHRAAAAHLLGYAKQSDSQISGLVRAIDDHDSTVRNNAIRALACLIESDASLARNVPAATFVDRLNSPIWSDRNKAVMILIRITAKDNQAVLSELRARGLAPLKEMASWQSKAHAAQAAILLQRLGEDGAK